MLSRRLIRIKVFKILFSKTITGGDSLIQAEKELIDSCDKTVDLYCMLLRLPVALKKIAEEKMEQGMRKFHPTPQEANPNKKFINNRVISLIENELEFNKKCDKKGLTWVDSKDFLKEFYKNLVTKQYFIDYMESDSDTMEEDKKFIRKFFEEEIDDNDNLDVTIEEMSLYWRDDTGYVTIPTTKRTVPIKQNPINQVNKEELETPSVPNNDATRPQKNQNGKNSVLNHNERPYDFDNILIGVGTLEMMQDGY